MKKAALLATFAFLFLISSQSASGSSTITDNSEIRGYYGVGYEPFNYDWDKVNNDETGAKIRDLYDTGITQNMMISEKMYVNSITVYVVAVTPDEYTSILDVQFVYDNYSKHIEHEWGLSMGNALQKGYNEVTIKINKVVNAGYAQIYVADYGDESPGERDPGPDMAYGVYPVPGPDYSSADWQRYLKIAYGKSIGIKGWTTMVYEMGSVKETLNYDLAFKMRINNETDDSVFGGAGIITPNGINFDNIAIAGSITIGAAALFLYRRMEQ